MPPSTECLFFMHIMKTAGTSFSMALARQFAEGEVAPAAGPDKADEYWTFDWLLDMPVEQREAFRVVQGHFPLFVGELIGADRTITILRDPVDRAISHIRHIIRRDQQDRWSSVEEFYEEELRRKLVRNYQVRQFSRSVDDDPLDLDERHLARARERLELVDVVGFTDRYDDFVQECNRRFGWDLDAAERFQVAPGSDDVDPAFRRVVEEDNQLDVAFYEYAREVRGA
ncbi:MAG: sulfotransferase family 2 domain-containing protein [Actinobacteria bacterium]|nr:sulfotransferase family 2 domain-containing protein [Actinomycetota bacterium]